MLLFIDNIFRFTQAGSKCRRCSAACRRPSATSRRCSPKWASCRSASRRRKQGIDHVGAGDLRARRRLHRSGAGDDVRAPRRDDEPVARRSPELGIYPAVDPLASTSRILDPRIIGDEHYNVARQVKQILQRYKDLQDIIAILGIDELSEDDQARPCRARARFSGSCRSRSSSPQQFTGYEGKYVPIADTIRGFKGDRRRQARRDPASRTSTWSGRSRKRSQRCRNA